MNKRTWKKEMVMVNAVLRLHSATSWTDEDAKKDVSKRTCKIKTGNSTFWIFIKRYNSFVQESDYTGRAVFDSQKSDL